ncbi:hypothetical protein ACH5RR_035161 [Cinchona calisaya]|uniref:HMA domain-containing protein n=1 Tax=Cinchona calisaya TaxID=153742 RepID=A0ABD2YGJ4_9GENT
MAVELMAKDGGSCCGVCCLEVWVLTGKLEVAEADGFNTFCLGKTQSYRESGNKIDPDKICYVLTATLSLLDITYANKTVVSVDLLCSKCRMKVMSLISKLEGITSIVLDPSKRTVTVIGEADPVCIIKQVRKFRRTAQITSIGPPKEEKKNDKEELPRTCQRCDVWYVIDDDYFSRFCNIL